jgi:hypothetical protein
VLELVALGAAQALGGRGLLRDGDAFVLAAGRQAKVLARNQLDDGCMATPAIAGKALYVRTKTHLYRIEQGS